jgi:hypothetical protein
LRIGLDRVLARRNTDSGNNIDIKPGDGQPRRICGNVALISNSEPLARSPASHAENAFTVRETRQQLSP